MCKEQTSVSHSSTESEVISLDAGPRTDGFPALDLCDIVTEVLRSTNDNIQPIILATKKLGQLLIPNPRPNMPQENRSLIIE